MLGNALNNIPWSSGSPPPPTPLTIIYPGSKIHVCYLEKTLRLPVIPLEF